MHFASGGVVSGRLFTALASSAAILVTAACGGTTSASSPDAGGARPEDGASIDGEWDGDLVPCNGGPVIFHMRATEGSNVSYCVGRRCRWFWLDLTTEHGETVVYSLDGEIGGLPVCYNPRPLTAEGEHLTWDGRVWVISTCGNQLPCWARTCATPGKYIATMCVNANPIITDAGFCSFPNSPQTCIAVEFEYPTAAIVEGVLP